MGNKGIAYLLIDNFNTDDAAPLATPRTCEPGPGILTAVETDGSFAISGGKLVFTAQTTPTWGDQRLYWAIAQNRVDTPAFIFTMNLDSVDVKDVTIGWGAAATGGYLQAAIDFARSAGMTVYANANSTPFLEGLSASVDYKCAIILRPTAGAFFIIQGGTQFPDPTLFWVDSFGVAASAYAGLSNYSRAGQTDAWKIYKAPSPWNTDYGIATNQIATPTTGNTTTSTADGIVEITWTPGVNEVLDLLVRRVDDNNCWVVRCDQAASTIKLFEKISGVETQRGTSAATWTVATPYRITVLMNGNLLFVRINYLGAFSYASASFQNTETGVKASGFATATNLISWPRVVTLPSEFAYVIRKSFLSIGDSKTASGVYQPLLATDMRPATGYTTVWSESPASISYNNETVALMAGRIDAELATRSGSPTFIFINLGVNEVISLPVRATWSANYLYVIDALHVKYPEAKIYLTRVGRRTYGANCTTLMSWMLADVVAARSSFVFAPAGMDEQVYLEGGDDYTTLTSDGIHPQMGAWQIWANANRAGIGY